MISVRIGAVVGYFHKRIQQARPHPPPHRTPPPTFPLGITKHGDGITRTYRYIRSINHTAALPILIICFIDDAAFVKRNRSLSLLSALETHIRDDQKEG